ncbi:MAG: VTC domain-containing protein, partial [Myxococcota bacterium]|nr:VTC domain-containing protein [Myxococcota bacterium]
MTGYQDIGRFEYKYVLPLADRDRVMEVIDDYVKPDPHATARSDGLIGYFNHSIYLDTEDLFDYHERLDESTIRNRLRVRTYGRPGDGAPVFLENKRKLEAWVVKQRVMVGDADSWGADPSERPWIERAARVVG